MADNTEENWDSLLPDVFELLIRKPEKIVDDTSIEKLLAWIADVCSTVNKRQRFLEHVYSFLSNPKVSESSTTASFALRVCGIIWCKDSGSFKENTGWVELFTKAKDSEVLWDDAAVRDAYFTGLTNLTLFDIGLGWLQDNKVCLTTAVNCMSKDTSMFVASSARLFIARFLISSYSSQPGSKDTSVEHIQWLIDCLCEKTATNSPDSTDTSKDRIAVLDIIRIMMDIDVSIGQDIISVSKLLANCLDMASAAEENVCRKLVEVISEIIEKYSNSKSVDWNKLFCSTDSHLAAQRLLKLSLDLYNRGMVVDSLHLISVLALLNNKSHRLVPPTWLNIISCLITAPLSALEDTATVHAHNSSHSNGIDVESHDTDTLTSELMSIEGDNTKNVEDKVKDLLKPWLTNKSNQIVIFTQALVSITEIVNKMTDIPIVRVTEWIEISLRILNGSLYTSEMPGFGVTVQGNDKVTKTLLTVLVALLRHLLANPSHSSCPTEAYFFDVLETFLFLARSSQTKATVITCALNSIGDLLECGSLFLTNHSANGNENTTASGENCTTHNENRPKNNANTTAIAEDPTKSNEKNARVEDELSPHRKRARLVDIKEKIKENIGHVVHLRLRDQRWEVKDSALEFVTRMVKSRTDFGLSIVENHTLPCVWDALDDDNESYVRSSAWQSMSYIVDSDALWTTLKGKQHITEKDVIVKILHTLEHDSEAFPRRSCIDCILLWIGNRNPIVGTFLSEFSESESATEMTALFTRIIKCAFEDFDWEVKLRGVRLVDAVISGFTAIRSRIGSLERKDAFSIKKLLKILHDVKALLYLLKACDDCDHPVCENALSVVRHLRNYVHFIHCMDKPRSQDAKEDSITTIEQLSKILQPLEDLSVSLFLDIVSRFDMESLVASCSAADSNIRSNRTCFLEDILACAKEDTENLLDCY